jgi:photosystem II stability/assembly factor-like uncharacterized protein
MSSTGLRVALEEKVLNLFNGAVRAGSGLFSTLAISLVVLVGCNAETGDAGTSKGDTADVAIVNDAPATYPNVDAGFLSALEWRFIGPYRGGRVVAVAGVVDDPLKFYFGAAHGGVWKTTDAGINWQNVSDGYFNFPAVGALDVSASDSKVIYAGTGEGLQRQFISPGDGVYKSTDGGDTWTNVGLKETRHIARLRIHPTNPDIVYVAAMGDMFGPNPDRGVYRSTDGGETWEQVLYKGETTGAVDLTIDPNNPNVIIAALNHHVTFPWDEESGGPTSGLFKSTDGGDSWTDITDNPGMPGGMVGKITVAISPALSSRVYAFMEADEGEGGVYRSDDAGASWQRTHTDPGKMEIPNSYNHLTADTQDPDIVYIQPIGGLFKSTDAGQTFNKLRMQNWDPHALWIDPNNSRRMIEGGDGGASVTLNGGESWSSLRNQPTADLLSLAVDDQEPYWVYASQNDNSHIAIPSQTDDDSIAWPHYVPLPAGEGGQTAVSPDGRIIYANDRAKTARIDMETGQAPRISVWPEWVFGTPAKDIKYRFYYSFPILLSQHDPNALYTAAQFVFKSTDEGQSWQEISPDLTRNRQEVMGETSGGPISSNASSLFHSSVIRTLAESPIKQGELWVGTDDSTVQVSKDGGRNWLDVSPSDLPEWTTITAIDVSHHQPGTAYISGEGHRVSDRTPYLYKTTNYGESWQLITEGIRENDYTWVIREDPVRPGLLYAGTETGAYVSFDDGGSWQSLQGDLPPVIVMQMQVKDDDLVVATHGRGFWILDNISALRAINPEIASAKMHLFEVVPTIRRLLGAHGWTALSGGAENPPEGVMFEYYLAQEANPAAITITVSEAGGKIIREFSNESEDGLSVDAGMNRFFWNMKYPGTVMPPPNGALDGFMSVDYSPPTAPLAPPGQYKVKLNVDGEVYERPFEIRKDPRIHASDADLIAQFELMVNIRDRFTEVADTVLKTREVRAMLAGDSSTETTAILDQLREIEGILMIWMGTDAHPMMWSAPGLTEKLSSLSGSVNSGDARPTQSMYTVFDDLTKRFEFQRERLNQIINQ